MKKLLTLFMLSACFPIYGQVITTFAGFGTTGYSGDSGPATAALLNGPAGLCSDASGNIYIADAGNNCIRKVNPAGIITTFAGSGLIGSGYSGDGGPATAALFFEPYGVSVDGSGDIFIADQGNDRIRIINPANTVNTFAGISGGGFSGDGGQATVARLYLPIATYIDGGGNVYISDTWNDCIRKVNPSGIINIFAGIGASSGFSGDGGQATAAQLNHTGHICIDGSGNVYIPDPINNRIRKVSPTGIISTFAGGGSILGDGGQATAAQLSTPSDICMDIAGNLYIADQGHSRVRVVNSSGIITTIAGTGVWGFSGDGGPPTAAAFEDPFGLCIDASGNLYISDFSNDRVRKICMPPALATITGTSLICASSSITFTASLAGGAWSEVTGNASVSPGGTVTGITPGIDTIKYTLTNSCYFTTAVFPVTVNPLPSSDVTSGVDSLCIGASTTLTASVPGGAWSSSGVAATIGSATGLVAGVSAGMVVISYAVANSCGSDTALFPFTVVPIPVAGSISGAGIVCTGAATTLTDPVAGGVWSTIATYATVGSATGIVSGVSAGTATISYSVANSCGTATATHSVTVDTLPVAGSISGVTTLCAGATGTLTDPVAGGIWSTATPYATVGSATGIVTGVSAGTALISYSVTNSCGTATATDTVMVTVIPVVPAISGDSVICNLETPDTLTDAATGGAWSVSGAVVNIGSSTGVVTAITTGTAVVSYSVAYSCGVGVATYTVTVSQIPIVPAISGHTSLCIDSSITLTDTAAGGLWSKSGTALSIGTATGIVAGISAGTDTIWYSLANACGTGNAYKTIHVVNCDTTAGVAPVMADRAGITVMPNPNNGTFTVNVTETINEPVQLIITNLVGQKIEEITTTTNKETPISLAAPPGMYFIAAVTQQTIQSAKIMIR